MPVGKKFSLTYQCQQILFKLWTIFPLALFACLYVRVSISLKNETVRACPLAKAYCFFNVKN